MHLKIKKYIALVSLLFCAFLVRAQDDEVTFQMSVSKEKLGINEKLRIDFSMNRDGDNFNPPDFTGFKVLMGPSQSIRNSWINGIRSYSKTYTYTLIPNEKGKVTIGQATIVVDGKTYKSLSKQIEITPAVEDPNAPPSAASITDENLHLVTEVSKSNPYLNEAVTVVYKLYISPSISVSNFRPLDNPQYNNFWSQDIPVTQYQAEEGTYSGQPYRFVVLKRVVLYPQKTGKLTIEPLSLEVTLNVPIDRRDFFNRQLYTSINKTLSSGNKAITVKEFPKEGKPENFTGAVGNFDFSLKTSKTSLNASESLQAIVKVKGTGNLKLFQLPEPTLPSSLEVYDPEFKENVKTTLKGMEGSVENYYTIVPSFKGKYPIPSISFSFFDPKTERYETLHSQEIMINVLDGPSNTGNLANAQLSERHTISTDGNQFQFIQLKTDLKPIASTYFFASKAYFIGLLFPLLLLPIALVFGKKRKTIASDAAGNKIKKANRLAKKYLSAANKNLGHKESFYVSLEKALHNYLKAKLKIETSEFSKDKIAQLLFEKQVDIATSEGFIALLKNCEMARYSPFSDVQMQQDYNKASEVIAAMDKQF